MKFRLCDTTSSRIPLFWGGATFGPLNLLFFDYVTLYTPLLDNFLSFLSSFCPFLTAFYLSSLQLFLIRIFPSQSLPHTPFIHAYKTKNYDYGIPPIIDTFLLLFYAFSRFIHIDRHRWKQTSTKGLYFRINFWI